MGRQHTKRAHADAIRAANMKDEGYTSRQIAQLTGKQPEQIKSLVLLGMRLKESRARNDRRTKPR